MPKIAGYRITFDYKDIPYAILLSLDKSKFTVKMKVKYEKENEIIKTFISKSHSDNQEILNQILLQ